MSAFYGASIKLNHTSANHGELSRSFKTAAINGEVRGVKVFYTHEIVIGLALLGEGGQVLAQEGPGKARDPTGEYYYDAFLFGANEKLVGFKFYTDWNTPRIGCILADMGTPQEGGVIDPALVPVHPPPLPIATILANVEPDACGGMPELWRFSEAAKPHNMPSDLRAHLTQDDYVALMDSVNAVLERHGAPKEGECFSCGTFCADGLACGILRCAGLMLLPLIFPVFCFEMDEEAKRKAINSELKAALAAVEAKGLVALFVKGGLLHGTGYGTPEARTVKGHPSGILFCLPPRTSATVGGRPLVAGDASSSKRAGAATVAPQPMVMGGSE